jgi:hypothetical protein
MNHGEELENVLGRLTYKTAVILRLPYERFALGRMAIVAL